MFINIYSGKIPPYVLFHHKQIMTEKSLKSLAFVNFPLVSILRQNRCLLYADIMI